MKHELLTTALLLWSLLAGLAGAAQPRVAPFTGFHRYRGAVGGQAVQLELEITRPYCCNDAPLECSGTLRLTGQHAVVRRLQAWPAYRPGQPLRLVEADSAQPTWRLADWQAGQPAGPVLGGTRTDAAGRRETFTLREDYLDETGRVAAAPYEVLHHALVRAGGQVMTSQHWAALADRQPAGAGLPPPEPTVMLDCDYLHLLGPDTLRPALARLQCAGPAQRHAALLRWMARSADGYEASADLSVCYNANGLLSWQQTNTNYFQGAAHPNHSYGGYVYDLNDSTYLELADVLRPGAGWALNGLLARHIAAWASESVPGFRNADGTWWVEPPAGGFALGEDGLRFTYSDGEVIGFGSIQPEVLVPWAELQPLLLPTSPVARMLRERGLWPPGPSR